MLSQLEIALAALKTIQEGSAVTGRWLAVDTGDAIDGSSAQQAPEGCFDIADQPDGACPAGLQPVVWASYTNDEQDNWIASCAEIAKRALREIAGTPETAQPGA